MVKKISQAIQYQGRTCFILGMRICLSRDSCGIAREDNISGGVSCFSLPLVRNSRLNGLVVFSPLLVSITIQKLFRIEQGCF